MVFAGLKKPQERAGKKKERALFYPRNRSFSIDRFDSTFEGGHKVVHISIFYLNTLGHCYICTFLPLFCSSVGFNTDDCWDELLKGNG